jgi:hypothetical protein
VHRLNNCDDLDNESGTGHSPGDWSSRVQYVRFAGNNGQGEVLGHVDTDEDSATSSSSSPSSPFSKVGFSKVDAAVELMNNTDDSFGMMEGGSSTGFVKKSESWSSFQWISSQLYSGPDCN